MKNIIIIDWKGSENNALSYFNKSLKVMFEEQGYPAKLITLDDKFGANLLEEINRGINFVFSFQGLGLECYLNSDKTQTVWDLKNVPFITFHGDHPSHNLDAHKLYGKFIKHIYSTPSFSYFANKYIERDCQALAFQLPCIFKEERVSAFEKNKFVLLKNYADPIDLTRERIKGYRTDLCEFIMGAAESIISAMDNDVNFDHHLYIEREINERFFNSDICAGEIRFGLHKILDHVYRLYATKKIVMELSNVPIDIYGYGWEQFKTPVGSKINFYSGLDASNSGRLFETNYGILDVAPTFDSLHDRTIRSCCKRTSFITTGKWASVLMPEFENLMPAFKNNNFLCAVERIMSNPGEHLEICNHFAEKLKSRFSAADFVAKLNMLAMTMRI